MPTAAEYGFVTPIGQRAVSGSSVRRYRHWLDESAAKEWRAIFVCAAVGISLQLGVFLAAWIFSLVISAMRQVPESAVIGGAMKLTGIICAMILLVAAVTKPEGRAEKARDVLARGIESAARHGSLVSGAATSVIMVVALYGGFALVEAAVRARMRLRVAAANRDEVARLLATISGAPLGLPPRALLKNGQSMQSLRVPVAALILEGWVQWAEGGKILVACSPARRQLSRRHPLADVFQPEIAS